MGAEANRTARRDSARWQRRHGMRVSGRKLAETLRNALLKRAREK